MRIRHVADFSLGWGRAEGTNHCETGPYMPAKTHVAMAEIYRLGDAYIFTR